MLRKIPRTPSDPVSASITPAEAAEGARAIVKLFAKWDLSDNDALCVLGGMESEIWQSWKAGNIGSIDQDLGIRLSLLLGIHKGLRLIFTDRRQGYDWIKRPNQIWSGKSALDIMLQGDASDIERIRSYLNAEACGW